MIWLSKKRRFVAGLLIATAIGAAFCLASYFNLLHGMQLQSSDFLFKAANLRPGTGPVEKIVIVAIDDKSLSQLGRFSSWPRSYHAQLVDVLAEAKARVVVFDILFSEPAPDDEQLVASIRHAGNVIVPLVYTSVAHKSTITGETIAFGNVLNPLETFRESAIAVGHANVLPDEDGVVRRLPLAIPSGEQYEPALALTAIAEHLRRPQVIESPITDSFLPFAGRSIPLDSANGMLINYTGDSAAPISFETVSYVDVLRGDIAATGFQDKIVVIGATASGIGDTYWTPLGRMMNGVEIHASAMNTILAGNFLRPVPSVVAMAVILILALLCGLAVLRLRILWAVLGTVLLGIIYLLTAFSFFDQGIMFNMFYPPLTILGTFVGVNLYNIAYERSEKREITKAFGRHVPPQVVSKILASLREEAFRLGGEQREVTVAFADMRGFTSLTERLQPEELVTALNTYLATVIKAFLKHEGMINKFGGDSVMAVWNAPMDCKEHALLAAMAAMEAQRAIRELQEEEPTLPKVDFGIGVNTGEVTAGNFGCEARLEYSVIGDAVNIAAKLTSAAPGGKVWIAADTFTLVEDYVSAEPLEPLVVKGKRQPVKAYELLDIRTELVDWQHKGETH